MKAESHEQYMVLKARKMAFVFTESHGIVEMQPKKPQTIMLMKVFDNKGEKTDVHGRKYSIVKCESIEIMGTSEGQC